MNYKQDSIPVGCVPTTWWLPLDVSTGGDGEERSSSEQI